MKLAALPHRCGLLLIACLVSLAPPGSHAQQADPSPITSSQKAFSSPDEAMKGLLKAVEEKDRQELGRIFGPGIRRLLAGDAVQEDAELDTFRQRSSERAELQKENDAKYWIAIGPDQWPFPIPIVKASETSWRFDTAAGIDELLVRRIGSNELETILTCRAYALAQWEYLNHGPWENDQVRKFAQKFISSPGRRDGLYWPTAEGEDPSPLGPLIGAARAEGYGSKGAPRGMEPSPYHGYQFRILKAQGPSAAGGRYRYIINGHMIGGFALVAYPSVYGQSGVMTFIVNQQGRVYQKDLGPDTQAMAKAMVEYNPDAGWRLVLDR